MLDHVDLIPPIMLDHVVRERERERVSEVMDIILVFTGRNHHKFERKVKIREEWRERHRDGW